MEFTTRKDNGGVYHIYKNEKDIMSITYPDELMADYALRNTPDIPNFTRALRGLVDDAIKQNLDQTQYGIDFSAGACEKLSDENWKEIGINLMDYYVKDKGFDRAPIPVKKLSDVKKVVKEAKKQTEPTMNDVLNGKQAFFELEDGTIASVRKAKYIADYDHFYNGYDWANDHNDDRCKDVKVLYSLGEMDSPNDEDKLVIAANLISAMQDNKYFPSYQIEDTFKECITKDETDYFSYDEIDDPALKEMIDDKAQKMAAKFKEFHNTNDMEKAASDLDAYECINICFPYVNNGDLTLSNYLKDTELDPSRYLQIDDCGEYALIVDYDAPKADVQLNEAAKQYDDYLGSNMVVAFIYGKDGTEHPLEAAYGHDIIPHQPIKDFVNDIPIKKFIGFYDNYNEALKANEKKNFNRR